MWGGCDSLGKSVPTSIMRELPQPAQVQCDQATHGRRRAERLDAPNPYRISPIQVQALELAEGGGRGQRFKSGVSELIRTQVQFRDRFHGPRGGQRRQPVIANKVEMEIEVDEAQRVG